MLLKRTLFFISITSIALLPQLSMGAPVINSVSGNLSHNQTITVIGSSFGSKSPVSPVLWDDGEHGMSLSAKGYCDYEPTVCGPPHNIDYHPGTFRSMSNPHSRGSRFISGGHEQNQPNQSALNGANVGITHSLNGTADKLYIIYYSALDPDYPTNAGGTCNHKAINWETRCSMYSRAYYAGHPGSHMPEKNLTLGWKQSTENPCARYGGSYCWPSHRGNWQHWIHEIDFSNFYQFYSLTGSSSYANSKRFEQLDAGPQNSNGTNAVTLGGYMCYGGNGCNCLGDQSQHCGHDDAFRYFDDIYIDTTLSRIMLANNANFDSATVIEPQIPQNTWNNSTIQCRVNLGKLPGSGTAFLFVFDAQNNRSSGYPVIIGGGTGGGGDSIPPEPPTGLRLDEW